MKKMIIGSCIVFCFVSCIQKNSNDSGNVNMQENYSTLAGTAWQMDYSREIGTDSIFDHVPPNLIRMKMFTKNHWVFVGYDLDKKEPAGMGQGTYTLDNDDYTENIQFHYHSDFNNKQFKAKLSFDSLYLYQRGKVDSLELEERWHRLK